MIENRSDDRLSFALHYLKSGLIVSQLIRKGNKKSVVGIKWKPFQHTLSKREHVESRFECTAGDIAAVTLAVVSRLLVFEIYESVAKCHIDNGTHNGIRMNTSDVVANSKRVETGGAGLAHWIKYKLSEYSKDDLAARKCIGTSCCGYDHHLLRRHKTLREFPWLKRQD